MNEMQDASGSELAIIRSSARDHIPINGSIELLPVCNMSCRMCYVKKSPEEVKSLGGLRSADEWLDLAEDMKKAGTLFLLLTGGEPLLYSDFKKVYEGLRQLGMILTVNTNGTLIDSEWADYFGENKPRRINITLYGRDGDTYERLCGYRDGYEKTVSAVRLLKSRGVDVKLNYSATPENVGDIDDVLALADELGVPVNIESYMYPSPQNMGFERLTPDEAADIWHKNLIRAIGDGYDHYRISMNDLIKIRRSETSTDPDIVCMAATCSFTISWQGMMKPCVMQNTLGVPVFEKGFDFAWKELTDISRNLHIDEKCRSCHLRPLCRICVANCDTEIQTEDGRYEYLCDLAERCFELIKL